MPDNDANALGPEGLLAAVRSRYAATATAVAVELDSGACCAGPLEADAITRDLYSEESIGDLSGALVASLGCGNPTALAALEPGQVVLDLGSGGGLDVLLSARRVGPTGKAYGLDMTEQMLELARRNQAAAGIANAEFLFGTIENVPLPDESVDVVISNCVINLSADKDLVFREAHRVLRSTGKFAVSDMVLLKSLPPIAMQAMALWTGCITGALLETDYTQKLAEAGFTGIELELTRILSGADLREMAQELPSNSFPVAVDVDALIEQMDGAIASAFIRATRP